MQGLHDLGDLLVRAAYLIGLAFAPPFLSPEPPPPTHALAGALVASAVLAALLVAAGRLRARLPGRDGDAATVLVGAAIAASVVAADVFRGERAPLGRGLLYVAPLLWAGLAVAAGAFAERRFSPGVFRQRRLAAMGAVLAVGAALFAGSWRWMSTSEGMWWAALSRDGDNTRAIDALIAAPLRARRYDAALRTIDRCLAFRPMACACITRRAEIGVRAREDRALVDARFAADNCGASRAIFAEALVLRGDTELAEQEARAELARGDDGRLHHALALALDRQGHAAEALAEARRAVELGAGRDGALLLGALAISAGDLDTAASALAPLVAADADDAEAQYDLALVSDRRGDYNRARQGYLAALRADPRFASARYNLTLLTLRRGVIEEARHHAQRFAEAFPQDPRGADLARRVAAAAAPR